MVIENNNIIPFVKMHGAGNDYIYINALENCPADLSSLSREISDRHFGIGSDGLIAILPSNEADFRMEMYNADGSRGKMCGNASRCIAKFLYHYNLTDKNPIRLQTDSGIKILYPTFNINGRVEEVSVDMGAPVFDPSEIPVRPDCISECGLPVVRLKASSGEEFEAYCVSMGNPHAVIITSCGTDLSDHLVCDCGREFEKHPAFPDYSNIEFIRILSPAEIEMRVWERGSGETLACGTGACASVVAGIITGRLEREVTVNLRGGKLRISWEKLTGSVVMTGGAEIIAEGVYFRKKL